MQYSANYETALIYAPLSVIDNKIQNKTGNYVFVGGGGQTSVSVVCADRTAYTRSKSTYLLTYLFCSLLQLQKLLTNFATNA